MAVRVRFSFRYDAVVAVRWPAAPSSPAANLASGFQSILEHTSFSSLVLGRASQFLKQHNIPEPVGLLKDASVDMQPIERSKNMQKIVDAVDAAGKDSLTASSYLHDPAKIVSLNIAKRFAPAVEPTDEGNVTVCVDDGPKSLVKVDVADWHEKVRGKEIATEKIAHSAKKELIALVQLQFDRIASNAQTFEGTGLAFAGLPSDADDDDEGICFLG